MTCKGGGDDSHAIVNERYIVAALLCLVAQFGTPGRRRGGGGSSEVGIGQVAGYSAGVRGRFHPGIGRGRSDPARFGREALIRRTIAVLIMLAGNAATVAAQDKGTLDPKPLPALHNPNDPSVAAKELFGRKSEPAPLSARSIGG